MNQAEQIADLKVKYIAYFSELPVQKYAAMSIGRDEDTIVRWKKDDADFAYAVREARANWVKRKAGKVRAEFALERLEKEIWSEKKEVEVKVDDRKKILEKYMGADNVGEATETKS